MSIDRAADGVMGELACTRRGVLRAAGVGGIGALIGSLAGVGLSAVDALPADAATDDYRALVCVFLFGGNDGYNMLVPTDAAGYSAYAKARDNLAVARTSLVPLQAAGAPDLGLHPSLAPLGKVFHGGHLGVVANVGSLLAPTRKADYKAGRNLPPALFSHNDQQTEWMLGTSAGVASGWAGRLADLMTPAGNQGLSMNISLGGTNLFETGSVVAPYTLGPKGGVDFTTLRNPSRAALINQNWARAAGGGDPFQAYLGRRYAAARDLSAHITSVLGATPALRTAIPNTVFGNELAQVARMIHARKALGARRQIFFVGMGGFDTHAGQVAGQPRLFDELSSALAAFYAATAEMGVAKQVTTFTHSDFGRTLTSNGAGSDHGWGSHHLVMGGAVRGGRIYGELPELALGAPLEVGSGRFIPTTSVDSYAATLARWFGARASDVHTLFPRLSRFGHTNVSFLPTH
ncbi:MAG TPA: DUF1501 domain-containing protein [Mycobacteriales bacterium]|nr:DUF1501 domain-containing protein [Mycobacteriales bacterium]